MSVAMQTFRPSQVVDRTYSSLQSLLDDPAQLFMSSNSIQRPSGGDLDILSASRYPQALTQPYEDMEQNPRKRKAAAAASSNHLYGGIVLATTPGSRSHSSSGEQDQTPTQKRSKATKRSPANDGDEQGTEKKQRGRPRLDTHDETAADRRRTQIRLAQRAYRHRKETTISALKQKVTDLQTTIEHMNKTFLTLHDNMVDAGILSSHYSLGRQLQAATEEFVALSKIATPESDEEEEVAIAKITQGGDGKPASEPGESKRRSSAQLGPKTSSRPAAATKTNNVRRAVSFDQSSTDAEADVEELPLMGKEDHPLVALSESAWSTDNSNLHGLNDLMSFNATIPDVVLFDEPNEKLVIERPLKPSYQAEGSYTYSFQETTFARRLHRMCLERAFRNLTNPDIDPEYIKRAFRFTFCFSNRKRMLQRFQEMLKRKAGESLENWNVPFFHIGGAGTHYPRRDDGGNPIYPPNMISPAKAFGPQPYVQAETPRMETSVQEMLDNIGFGGVWFDSHDVEEYLKSKGIYLDGQSSFIEVDPSVLPRVKASMSSPDGTSSSNRSPLDAILRTPSPILGAEGLTDPITDPFIARELGEMFARPSTLFPSLSSTSTTAAATAAAASEPRSNAKSADDPWADFAALASASSPPTFSDLLSRRPNPLTFDVEMFLERMILGSACLGRAPGFRKETIDEALVMSLQESF
ncbi:uncharacterized protein Z520_09541 [Fonsecaea multimorphosa CBS 102226]|uniref:BZIP domain-containing protein n=1 Tax=Fonsecaea multimorphosa CBS 102226 TaxID=1442371 RepID=A0A0D2ICH1_9EURO|nr:uncharacterized protein Z520_09541 [Fonsecaea multimorphosa CBS 102226]KIX94851.1 hypothetical protein Z520_09541 [Fonsecaea multimorphosa CBS 102226]OAL20428.1 hypothetical protein AYO22_08922 [Fonsecaea multimorphosa]